MKRIAIVCQPWDVVVPDSGSSIPIIAYQIGRRLAAKCRVVVYGRRGPGQKRQETDGQSVEFRRLTTFRKPWAVVESLAGIAACALRVRIGLLLRTCYHFFYFARIAASAKAARYDAIVVFNFPQFASLIKRVNPSATVVLYMECAWLTQFGTDSTARHLRRIDLVIGCSDYVTNAIKERFPGIAGQCHTVHNGVDSQSFRPVPRPASDPVERLLYVGRLSPEKGIHVLIDAFRIVARTRPKLELHLVGSADLLGYLYFCPAADRDDAATAALAAFYGDGIVDMIKRQLVHRGRGYLDELRTRAGDTERIVFHGAVSQAETTGFFHSASVLVFPSVWNEPFGMPTLEAIACGVPVVATVSGGIPEIVAGRTGLLVKRGDAQALAEAIVRTLDGADCAVAMSEAGDRTTDRFSWDAIALRLAGLIERAALLRDAPGSMAPSRVFP